MKRTEWYVRRSILRCGGLPASSFVVMAALVAGCAPREIRTDYAASTGRVGVASLHGTGLLAEAFRRAGHEVTFTNRLSSGLDKADIVVWFPDDYGCLSDQEARYVRDWLRNHPAGTWIYVRRDYQAVTEYVEQILTQTNNPRQYWHFRAWHLLEHQRRRSAHISCTNLGNTWFDVDRLPVAEKVVRLSGDPRWLRGVQVDKTDLWLGEKIHVKYPLDSASAGELPSEQGLRAGASRKPSDRENNASGGGPQSNRVARVLLGTEYGPFVVRFDSILPTTGKLILVANGSFLLNYGLTNPENEKLAMALIDECQTGHKVVIVRTDPPEAKLRSGEQEAGDDTPWYLTWPLVLILAHAGWWGSALLLGRFPIFGQPARDAGNVQPNIGQHVDALGELLAQARDDQYCRTILEEYQQPKASVSGLARVMRRNIKRI
ncbi:MAG: hypothetical protein KatS3mg110_3824 [Pirellulaceae bacterium]|nr:MAG: hypothetical protein KatS3mg110_3824 [Pirellulaceae bacterium]